MAVEPNKDGNSKADALEGTMFLLAIVITAVAIAALSHVA